MRTSLGTAQDGAKLVSIDTQVELATPENISFQYSLAGPFRRFPAWVADLLIKGSIIFVVFLLLTCGGAMLGRLGGSFGIALSLVGIFLISYFYGVFFESVYNGKTPGKWMMGIRVVSVDGHPISGVQAMLRNLLRLADLAPPVSPAVIFDTENAFLAFPSCLVGLAVMACTSRMQRLGDLAAGTMVIIDERAWSLPVVKVDDPRIPALASFVPADFRFTQTLSRSLAQYAERRAYLTPARRREVARKLAEPLIKRFEFRADVDPDLLLYSLYWKVFLSDARKGPVELGTLAGYSPLLRDQHRMPGPESAAQSTDAPPRASAAASLLAAHNPISTAAIETSSALPTSGEATSDPEEIDLFADVPKDLHPPQQP